MYITKNDASGMQRCWLMWRVRSHYPFTDKGHPWLRKSEVPGVVHHSFEEAKREADRLAKKHGDKFAVFGLDCVMIPPSQPTSEVVLFV